MKVEEIMMAGSVKRFHTVEEAGPGQTIFEHSCGVAVLLCEILGEEVSAELLQYALMHDVSEKWTGDMPAHAKWWISGFKEAYDAAEEKIERRLGIAKPDDLRALKCADMLEMMFYCVRQARIGNRNFEEPFSRGAKYLVENDLLINQKATEILLQLKKRMGDICPRIWIT